MRMRNIALALLLIAALAVVLTGCSSPAASSGGSSGSTPPATTGGATAAVTLQNFAFSPSTVQVSVGGSVTWTNNDSVTHTVTGDGFDSGQLAPGKSFSKTFAAAGTFNYHCSIHPSMTGVVTVK
jgi:plastocyanin